ncbi:type II toxin-antitoxin system VapC family toxin [Microbacterium sp. IEGM 1404]|uniref:type II toxin-antitoxin system VapC family toxin n=1 Tax=Microbacterium sp. IEGM 1404 TaxID=3047084 RepID=UPI0024B75DD3|nr:type II toxin-antitoxin system VapC family toxin [Microbacterium sp. IEGM 1404]MDI9892557.1 type II toxin-antitoxin system VapC family toxin [Microbacterium sp. IEGM 1404]
MIYVDSCLVIYAVERDDGVGSRAREALAGSDEPLATSPLVMLEALVGPMRAGDALPQAQMWNALDRFELLPLDDDDYLRAARLRARHRGLQTADALHLAVAQRAGCTAFWTNDARLAGASGGLAVDVIGGG